MGLKEILELDDERVRDVLRLQWDRWAGLVPALERVSAGEQLATWRRSAPAGDVDRVLRGLAELASVDGRDEVDAARVLAWLMLPAAKAIVGEIRGTDVDAHVAARLWIEVRTYPWATSGWVAANIARRVRAAVLLDLDSTAQVENHDKTQARTVVGTAYVAAVAPVLDPDAEPPDPLEEVLAILDWACANEVITDSERQLLLDVLAAAGEEQGYPARCQPLLGDRVSERVGARLGVTGRTVRRHAQRSIASLAASLGGLGRAGVTGLVA